VNAAATPAFFTHAVLSLQQFLAEHGWSLVAFSFLIAVVASYAIPVLTKASKELSHRLSRPSAGLQDSIAAARAEQEEKLRHEAAIEAEARKQKEIEKRRERQRQAEEELGTSGGRRLGDVRSCPRSDSRIAANLCVYEGGM